MPHFRVIHTIELKPDVERELFEMFMRNQFLPAIRALRGCLQVQFLKGYKGELTGVAQSEHDYGWTTLWESAEANNAVWSKHGVHHTPDEILEINAKLHYYAANYALVGGFIVESTV
jgi:heme-degrading monooxygenase HmoA